MVAMRRAPRSVPRVPLITSEAIQWLDKGMLDVKPSDFSQCDAVVHLAAHSSNVPYDSLESCIYWNVLAPLSFFRQMAKGGVRRLIVAGSCFEYGRAGARYEFIPPDAPLEPTHSYPASKAAASIAFCQLAGELGLELSIHRIFHVFGEGEAASRMWPSLRAAALAGLDYEMTPAEQIRDFIPVEEVAFQLVAACFDRVASGRPLIKNLGSGQPRSLRDFASEWWRHWGASGNLLFGAKSYRQDEVMRYVALL